MKMLRYYILLSLSTSMALSYSAVTNEGKSLSQNDKTDEVTRMSDVSPASSASATNDGEFKGSTAFNSYAASTESVNGSTLSLEVSYPLLNLPGINKSIPLAVSLIYNGNEQSILGLPKGWGYDIPFIIGNTLSLQGKTYVIDFNWISSEGYQSGLRYSNTKGLKFSQLSSSEALPYGVTGNYLYTLRNDKGMMYYFDRLGKLRMIADPYGNHIDYRYRYADRGLVGNAISDIRDSYGHVIKFVQDAYSLSIIRPDGVVSAMLHYGGDKQLYSVSDALGYETFYRYGSVRGQRVITGIDYPTGLKSQISYDAVTYKHCGGGQGYYPMVNSVRHLDEHGKFLNKTLYSFGHTFPNRNYTGSSLGYCLSNNKDGLLESNNDQYRYDVLTQMVDASDRVVSSSDTSYNYMHLVDTTRNYLLDGNGSYQGVEYRYTHQFNKHYKSAGYMKPILTRNYWHDGKTGQNKLRSEVQANYDDYGNLLQSSSYIYKKGNKDETKQLVSHIEVQYQPSYGSELASVMRTTDGIAGTVVETRFTLTKDKKSIESKKTYYRDESETDYTPWKMEQFEYDLAGRIIGTTLSWLPNATDNSKLSDVEEISNNYSYKCVDDNGNKASCAASSKLEVTESNALGKLLGLESKRTYAITLPSMPLVKSISPEGRVSTNVYDVLGRLLQATDSGGEKLEYHYSIFSATGENSQRVHYDNGYEIKVNYDVLGHKVAGYDNEDLVNNKLLAEATNLVRKSIYNNVQGKVSKNIDRLGYETSYTYDAFGRLLKTTDPLGNSQETVYRDKNNKVFDLVNDVKRGMAEMDNLGQVIASVTYPYTKDGASFQSSYTMMRKSYNGSGDVIQNELYEITPEGNETLLQKNSYRYNLDGKVVASEQENSDGSGVSHELAYDLSGNQLQDNKTVHYGERKYDKTGEIFVYDTLGQLISRKMLDDGGKVVWQDSYTYTEDGLKSTHTRNDGTVFHFKYDHGGSLIEKQWLGHKVELAYDNVGNLVRLSQAGQPGFHYEYYPDGEIKSVIYPDGKQIVYHLDHYGRLQSIMDQSGEVKRYTYSDQPHTRGLISSIDYHGDSLSYHYGQVNGKWGVLTASDFCQADEEINTSYQYDDSDLISKIDYKTPQQQVMLSYQYDVLGRKQLVNRNSSIKTNNLNITQYYQYDGLNQLIEQKSTYGEKTDVVSYQYDGNSNVIKEVSNGRVQTYHYNILDQLQLPGVFYDLNGRMIEDNQGKHYRYNELDQLLSVRDANYTLLVSYRYYVDELLYSRETTGGQQDVFYYDQDSVNGILSGDDKWVQFFVAGGKKVSSYQKGIAPVNYLAGSKSVTAILQQGHLQGYNFDAYGKDDDLDKAETKVDRVKLPASKNFIWNGEYRDPESGLTYLRARFYNPELKQFMTMDSYAVANKYNFADGNPVNKIDPSGHAPQWLSDAIGGAFLALDVMDVATGGGASAMVSVAMGAASFVAGRLESDTANDVLGVMSLKMGVSGYKNAKTGLEKAAGALGITSSVTGITATHVNRHQNMLGNISLATGTAGNIMSRRATQKRNKQQGAIRAERDKFIKEFEEDYSSAVNSALSDDRSSLGYNNSESINGGCDMSKESYHEALEKITLDNYEEHMRYPKRTLGKDMRYFKESPVGNDGVVGLRKYISTHDMVSSARNAALGIVGANIDRTGKYLINVHDINRTPIYNDPTFTMNKIYKLLND